MTQPGSLAARIRSFDRLDMAIVSTAGAIILASVVALGLLDLHIEILEPGLDAAIDTTSTVVTGTVAGLALLRHRERAESIALYQAAAFLVLLVASGYALLLVLGEADGLPDVARIAVSQATPWIFATSRLLTAGLLVVGGLRTIAGRRVRHPRALFLVPAIATVVLMCGALIVRDSLPPLSTPFLPSLATGAAAFGVNLPMSTPLGSILQLVAAAGFLWAATLTRTIFRRDRSIGDAYIAVGLVFAAGAQVHVSFYPGTFPGVVTSGDFLGLTFDVFLLLGIYAEAGSTLQNLRRANASLLHLADTEAENAALEERARLSRDLHDGLAQTLWLAKLQAGRLGALEAGDPGTRPLTEALIGVVDTALTEARQAVLALRLGRELSSGSLDDLLQRYADDFSDRFGVEVECSFPDRVPRLGARAEAEVVRIVQEALTNVRRHADATVAKLEATVGPRSVTLRIQDNGRGFDPDAGVGSGVGIRGMRERAALIQARLTISTQPSGGTTVTVDVPIPAAAGQDAAS